MTFREHFERELQSWELKSWGLPDNKDRFCFALNHCHVQLNNNGSLKPLLCIVCLQKTTGANLRRDLIASIGPVNLVQRLIRQMLVFKV